MSAQRVSVIRMNPQSVQSSPGNFHSSKYHPYQQPHHTLGTPISTIKRNSPSARVSPTTNVADTDRLFFARNHVTNTPSPEPISPLIVSDTNQVQQISPVNR